MSATSSNDGEKGRGPPGEVIFSKTCQNCFSLKIRCDRTQRTDTCDRCARLNKQCLFRPARRRDNSAKRDTRIQALEAQVENLLRTQNPTQTAQLSLPALTEHPALAKSIGPTSSVASSVPLDEDVIDEDILTIERADTLVELYRTEMMPHFPFVIVPPWDTGQRMRYQKPYLFLAICMVASFHDMRAQEILGERLKQMSMDKIFYGGNDCLKLEYLQGLLVVLAWNHYHGQSQFYSQYITLAVSVAADMRLDRKPIDRKPKHHNNKRDPLVNGEPGTQIWGAGEQRAAAGLFFVSSTISKLLDKMTVFPCTKTIEEGCLGLGSAGEYRTDKDLYHVIRLQRIIENIESLAKDSNSDTETHNAYLCVRAELEEFRAYLNNDFSDSHLLSMQFHTAKLFLYQIAFFERNLQKSPLLHLPLLNEGLESAKNFLDLFLWLPPKSEMALTNIEWVQLSFGVTQAAKFAIVSRAPNVEQQTREMRLKLNIEHVFRHLSLRVGALVGRQGDKNKDIFAYYEKRVKRIQNWYEKMIRATSSQSQSPNSTHSSPPQHHSHTHSPYTPSYPSQPPPQVPLDSPYPHQPSTLSHQPPLSYSSNEMLQTAIPNVGLSPVSAYPAAPYLAFPDLMSAPGWDTLFSIPMEDTSWFMDVNQGYENTLPPNDPRWGDGPGNI